MWLSEPYPSSPSGGSIQDQVTSYLSGLVPPGLIDTGVSAFFTVMTVIVAALGYHHARRGKWLSGWLSGPSAVLTALIAASYGVSGLPDLFGVDPSSREPRSLLVVAVVALLAAVLVAGAAWPVAAHASASSGSPISVQDLREWVFVERLHAGGGGAAGAAVAWIVFNPLLVLAGAVIGLLVTAVAVTLRAPAARPEQTRPPVVPPPAPVPPVVSDEGW